MFFDDIRKLILKSNTEYDRFCTSSFSLHFEPDIFNLLFLFDVFIFFHVQKMLRFNKAAYLSPIFNSSLSERLSNNLWGSDVLLFLEFLNKVFILFYNFIDLIILLYTFLVLSFARYKEYTIWHILFIKFPDVLPVFTSAKELNSFKQLFRG